MNYWSNSSIKGYFNTVGLNMLDETSRNIIINKSTGNFKKHFLFRKCFPERCIHLKEIGNVWAFL